jgi:hypothetical protein
MSSQFVRYEEGRRDDVENAGQEEDSRGQSPKLNRLLPKKRWPRRTKKRRRNIMVLIGHRSNRDHEVSLRNKRTRLLWGLLC